MKANKGFTLIELLAVIVVLAIIALIATPVVLSAIGTARDGANLESARGFAKAAEFYCATELLEENEVTTLVTAGISNVDYKGTVPSAVDFTLDGSCRAAGTLTVNSADFTVAVNGTVTAD